MSRPTDRTLRRTLTRRQFLRQALVGGGLLASAGSGFRWLYNQRGRQNDYARTAALLEGLGTTTHTEVPPNILLIVADDLGYGDLGCYGNALISTPNLDMLAKEGLQLTDAYASAPLCSPSRAGLLSGRYPIRTHITLPLYPSGSPMDLAFRAAGARRYGVTGIPADEALLPEILQQRGYRTALVGKWHLGDRSPNLPNDRGFDLFYGAYYSNSAKRYAIYRNRDVVIPAPVDQDTLTQRLTQESLRFILDDQRRPFFLYYAQPFPHVPLHASRAFQGRSSAGLYGDVVEEIDWSVGVLLQALAEAGLAKNTLVIFTSDNGPWWEGSPGYTRGRKNLPFEGGYRVPFLARWPGVIPAGQTSRALTMNFDILPTCLDAAGIAVPDDRIIDGRTMLPVLQGKMDHLHETLFYYKGANLLGVRHGPWKYLRRHLTDNGGYASLRQGPFLFNLESDPNESYCQIASHPEIAAQLAAHLEAQDARLRANLRGWL